MRIDNHAHGMAEALEEAILDDGAFDSAVAPGDGRCRVHLGRHDLNDLHSYVQENAGRDCLLKPVNHDASVVDVWFCEE